MPGRVIEHQQDLLARQVIPPPGRPRLQARRDLPGADPGRQQQARQRVGGINRPLPRGVRVQRQEQLPVREPLREPVRRVHRQGGLADPGHPADRTNPHHPPARRRAHQLPQQLPKLGAAAGEAGDVTRQRPRHRRGGRRGDLLAQHRLLQLAQLLPRLDPQLLGQHLPGALVGGQRVGLPLGPVQRQHQQPPQPFAHRVLGHQLFQLADHLPARPRSISASAGPPPPPAAAPPAARPPAPAAPPRPHPPAHGPATAPAPRRTGRRRPPPHPGPARPGPPPPAAQTWPRPPGRARP